MTNKRFKTWGILELLESQIVLLLLRHIFITVDLVNFCIANSFHELMTFLVNLLPIHATRFVHH